MRAKERFQRAFKSSVAATLSAMGFNGRFPTFRRDVGKTAFLVNVQAAGGGHGCYVNLGVHHRALAQRSVRWDALHEYECPLRARMWNVAGDELFAYGDTDEDATLAAVGMSEMLKTEGAAWMAELAPGVLGVTIKRLAKKGVHAFVPYGAPASAETFAKLAKALGDAASERAFVAQAMKAAKERARQDAEAEAARSATTLTMTMDEYRAAKKAGTIPMGSTIQLVAARKKAAAGARKKAAAGARKKAAAGARKKKR
jgi:hypothetical protein